MAVSQTNANVPVLVLVADVKVARPLWEPARIEATPPDTLTWAATHNLGWYVTLISIPLTCKAVVAFMVGAVMVFVNVFAFANCAYLVVKFVPASCKFDDALIVSHVKVPVKVGLFVGAGYSLKCFYLLNSC